MVRVLISKDAAAFEAARRSAPDAVVVELDGAFGEVIDALMPDREVPRPGFLAQARRNAADRRAYLDSHGALTAEEVADLAGSRAANRRQTAHRWAQQRKVFAVEHRGRRLFPGFQFDQRTGRPRPAVRAALTRLPAALDGWALALWWDTPTPDGGDWVTPLKLLDDVDRLARLATAEAERWRREGAA